MSIPGAASPLLFASVAAEAAGYQIDRSLRFNSSDSAYLSRTPASAGNRKTWTWSGWIKRNKLGSNQTIFEAYTAINDTGYTQLKFRSADTLNLSGWNTNWKITTQVFRDVSAWMHLVVAFDVTQATGSDRIKFYVNGQQITDFGTDSAPSQNTDHAVNNSIAHYVGYSAGNSGQYADLMLADVYLIDGQALDPTSFTEVDATTGQLVPIAYSGTYGTNGFHLPFSDNSTAAALGTDTSGNSNTWTVNNISVAAGSGNDSLVDTPTNYGTDTGAGGEVRGNYATLNPLNVAGGGLSNGNLDLDGSSNFVQSTIMVDSGKYYFEFTKNGNGDNQLGIAYGGSSASTTGFRRVWRDNNGSPVWLTDGSNAGSGTALSCAVGDVIGVALDMDNNAVYFSKNGTYMNSGDPTSGSSKTGAIWTDLSGQSWGPNAGSNANGVDCSLNTGQRPFAYTAPSGFKSLCTTNLPDPTIADGSTAMDVALYTGNGSTQTISGLNFSPDLAWIKRRDSAGNHALFDQVRGAGKFLISSSTSAEGTDANSLTGFTSDGFSVGQSTTAPAVNGTSQTYVGWAWDGGTSTVSNTDGSITSSVRANASTGFSIVTYTGTGSGTVTVGHGLNAKPELIIVKDRDLADNWWVQHGSQGHTKVGFLNLTNAFGSTSLWGAAPTSSVFSIGSSGNNANDFVAYCFAPVEGYSAFGSYTGNGSADGPFVYTGFRPRWVLIKRTGAAASWVLHDTERSTYNVSGAELLPNDSGAEYTYTRLDFLSNGFKARTTEAASNTSGNTYVYAAFAEHPFKTARAR